MQIENSTAQAYQPPANGFRTFLIVWITQSISVIGSALTFFSLTIWLTQVLYPLPEQKPQLAIALSLISLATGLTNVFIVPIAGHQAVKEFQAALKLFEGPALLVGLLPRPVLEAAVRLESRLDERQPAVRLPVSSELAEKIAPVVLAVLADQIVELAARAGPDLRKLLQGRAALQPAGGTEVHARSLDVTP